MFECFKKQNINFVEILFTKYKKVNPEYESLYRPMFESAEMIARYNNYASINCMAGMCMEKYKALEKPYPATRDKISRYGYDPKQLHHIIRIHEFMVRFIGGEQYKNCLVSENTEYLINVKKGCHTLNEARSIASEFMNSIEITKENYMLEHELSVNKDVEELLNNTLIQILKRSFLLETGGE